MSDRGLIVFSRIAADIVVLAHLLFVVFVVFGGLLSFRRPKLAWLHVPAVFWGALVELAGWVCPLTPLENRLRAAAGGTAYGGAFIDRYIVPIVYPVGLTRPLQVTAGFAVIGLNLMIYGLMVSRAIGRRKKNT